VKKYAAESQGMLSKAYGDYIPLISICDSTCIDFHAIKKGDLDMEERPSRKNLKMRKWELYLLKIRIKRKKNLQNH